MCHALWNVLGAMASSFLSSVLVKLMVFICLFFVLLSAVLLGLMAFFVVFLSLISPSGSWCCCFSLSHR